MKLGWVLAGESLCRCDAVYRYACSCMCVLCVWVCVCVCVQLGRQLTGS